MNRFYLFISIFLIQFIGFSQVLEISIVDGSSTYECLQGSQPAQALINVDSPDGIIGTSIQYQVVDSFGNDVGTPGFFNNQLNTIIEFNQPGEYLITAYVADISSDPITFTVNPSLNEIETSEILPEYYLCDGDKQIEINIINTDPDLTYSIIVSSENTYSGSDGEFPGNSSVNLNFDSSDNITSIQFFAEDESCTITKEINDIAVLTGPTKESSVISLLDSNPLCLDAGSTDNIINLNVVDEEFTISDFDSPIGPFTVDNLPINLQGVYEDSITIVYASIDCSIKKPVNANYGVIYDTEFTVSKLKADESEVLEVGDIDLCNDEKIVLTNTSVHRSECPSCFEWFISGSPADLIIDDAIGTATFSYDSDDPAAIWKLVYTEETGFCSDSLIETRDVNTDYIDAKFTTNLSAICDASGDVIMDNTTTVVDNDTYTYNWNFDNNSGSVVSLPDSANPTVTLPSPGVYDITLQVTSSTGCFDDLDSTAVVRVTGDTEFTVSKLKADESEVLEEASIVLCNDEKIVLTNTSVHQSECPSCFTWVLPGVDPDSLVINVTEGTAIFNYASDVVGESWTLSYETYDEDGILLCTDDSTVTRDVNVDYIDPVLSDGLIQLSCSFDTVIELDHQTVLGNDVTDDYLFTWIVIPNDTSYGYAIQDTIFGTESPTFNIESIYNQSYSVQLEIENQDTQCSGSLLSQDFFTISAVDNSIESNSTSTCLPNLVEIYTQDIDIIETYSWIVSSDDTLISISSNEDSLSLDLPSGQYDVFLTTETFDGCIHQVDSIDYIIVNDYEVSINDVSLDTICFNGSNSVTKEFSSLITPEVEGLPFNISDFTWKIISSNSISTEKIDSSEFSVEYLFTEPGVYNILYSATIQGSNNNCEYVSEVDTFYVGIDVEIVSSPIICVGGDTFTASMDSADTWSDGLSYFWSSNSFIDITSPNDSSTSISTDSLIDPDVTLSYDLTLRAYNDRGCWEEETVNIDAYQVHAGIQVSDGLLNCLPQDVEFLSSHNDYIDEYNWNLYLNDSCDFDINGYSNTFSDYSIGDTLLGGVLFSIDNQSLTGLVVAYEDLPGNYEWGCLSNGINGANNPSGYVNTQDIINTPCSTLNGGITAAQAATNANINGYNDWFLPSIDELETIYDSIALGASAIYLNNFSDSSYWSSTQLNSLSSYNFSSGTSSPVSKSGLFKVRPIRSVSISESCLYPTEFTSINQNISASIDTFGYFDIYLDLTSIHGCSDSLFIDSTLVVNDLNPTIETLDTLICFDGDSVLNKQFILNFNSSLDVDFISQVSSFDWLVSPVDGSYFGEAPSVNSIESIDTLSVSFNTSAAYNISYSFTIESTSGVVCSYFTDTIIEIGVDSRLNLDSIVCVGQSFNVSADVLVGIGDSSVYSWASSGLSFSDSVGLSSEIFVEGSVEADSIEYYDIEFTVLNDNGCWMKNVDSIPVYEVVANFTPDVYFEECAFEDLYFISHHNEFISSYEWSYNAIKYDGDLLDSTYTDNNDTIFKQFSEMGVYSFSLSLISEHGCTDSILRDSLLDIKRPYPSWNIDPYFGCNELTINIDDSSTQIADYYFDTESYFPFYQLNSIVYNSYSPYLNVIDSIGILYDTLSIDSTYISVDSIGFLPYQDAEVINNLSSDSILVLSSEFVNNTFVYDTLPETVQPVQFIDDYQINGLNTYEFEFPYNDVAPIEVDTTDIIYTGTDTLYIIDTTHVVEYDYPLTLSTYLNECSIILNETITVFADPIIDVSFTADSGCNPGLTVDFFDHSTYVDSDSAEYLWNFGTLGSPNNVCCSSVQNPSWYFPGTLGDTAVYDVYLTITSNRGCSTTEFITTVRVYDNPQANFDYTSGPFCYGLADVYFSDSTSILTTSDPIDSVIWTYNGVDSLEEINQDYMIHFDATGTYEVSLEIVDIHGCRDTITDSEVYVEELDTIVALPILNYVSWSDSGIVVNFAQTQDDNFSRLEVWHNFDDGDPSWLPVNLNIDSLNPNHYTHELGSPGLSELSFANNYFIKQVDSCGYQSDSSIIHSSILLEASSDEYQEIDISWTRYRGWEYNIVDQSIVPDTVEIIYTVYRSENNIDFESIITIADSIYPSLPYIDSKFSYTDIDLCNLNYTYYVIASHPDIEDFVSKSNNVNIEPKFVDFTKPLNLSYTTVNIYGTLTVDGESVQNYTLTEWEELDQSDMNYYKVDRFDNYYGWQEEVNNVTDSIYLDFNADVNNDEYLYRVSYWDDCGNEGPESNIGSNILLIGVQNSTHYDLNWNPYKEWSLGVQNYIIEYYQSQNNIWVELDIVSGTTLDYRDSDLQKNDLSDSYDLLHGVDTSYCYRVRAIGYNGYESQSNEYCFIAEPTNYFPNAFSPNNDGINDYLEYRFSSYQSDNDPNIQSSSFVKSINLQIFNKWGNLVFETNDLDFKWDGTIQNNGEVCPQGAYVLRYELIGYNGSVISDKGLIYLLR